jgi:hypothetical protein
MNAGNGLVFSQEIKQFTADPVIFPQEMKTFFEQVTGDNSQDVKKMMSEFEDTWKSGTFNSNQQTLIYYMSNLMLKSQLKPYPYFYNYLRTIVNFTAFQFPASAFTALHSSLEPLIIGPNKRKLSGYLENINMVIEEHCLYNAAGTTWKFRKAEYAFNYDTIPELIFAKLDLACYASRDSIAIFDTRGIYYPTLGKWKGKGGRVTWERAGYDPDMVYAELDFYEISLEHASYTAESVKFINKEYFRQPLFGQLEDKVMANTTPENAVYPKFTSNLKRIQILNLFDKIDYDGGFTMEGHVVIGSGYEGGDASVIIKKNRQEFMILSSQRFMILKDRILSDDASLIIYYESDSIFHPDLRMKYIDSEKELTLMRGEEGLSLSPFFDSYHEIDMYFEALTWKLDKPTMDFEKIKSITPESKAVFESNEYYSENRFERLKGIDEVNPLIIIKNLVRNIPSGQFYAEDLSNSMGISIDQVRAIIITLAGKGFLDYNPKTELVTVKDKLYKYIDSKGGRRDYDVILFPSDVKDQSNATLNINTFDITIKGVPQVFLSDSQQVFIFPRGNQIILRNNRDFIFSGRIHAGLLDFYASNCSFNYDTFKLNMPVIDSLSFMVHGRIPDDEGKYPIVPIRSVIRNLNGTLWIDYPQNKSSLKDYPKYPYFTSKDISFVYYNDTRIENGIYDSSRFYYQVEPFTFDSLNTFSTDNLEFKGKLVSGGILPEIDSPLKVQDDYSLGFKINTPLSGYPLYGGKGLFFDTIQLSNSGLKGDGRLQYLNSNSVSHNFTFYPNSTKAVLDTFNLSEQFARVEYPFVRAGKSDLSWFPYADSMLVSNIAPSYLGMYKDQVNLDGTLCLTPDRLNGWGKLHIMDADLVSTAFSFKQHVIDADTTKFSIRTPDGKQVAFTALVGNSHVDLDERKGSFRTGGQVSKVYFPFNQFICYMNEFDWFMDESKISLNNTLAVDQETINKMSYSELINTDLKGSDFISLHPGQDSLRFFSTKATMDLTNNMLTAEGVRILKIADAAIFPGDSRIIIGPGAAISPLSMATIMADTSTKYHSVYNASVNILSAKNYLANGYYDYTDETGKVQQIKLGKITVDTAYKTTATGNIPDSAFFRLSPQFDFIGQAFLYAPRQYLVFKGGYRIRQDCISDTLSWVRFTAEINPDKVVLPVSEELTDLNNRKLSDGILLSLGQTIYPAFFRVRERYNDAEIISSKGYIFYDKKLEEFKVGSLDRLNKVTRAGNLIILNNRLCTLYGDGIINLGLDYGEVKLTTYGSTINYLIPDSTIFSLVMGIDFFFADELLNFICDTLQRANLKAVNITSEKYIKALTDILGTQSADKLISDINLYGSLKKLPQELEHTLFFSHVNMVWNPVTRSYISAGPIGIGNIKDRIINKYVDGYIELAKKRSGDVLNIYLKPSNRSWYYLNFTNHVMQVVTSDVDFNNMLINMKEKYRVLDLEDTKEEYQFIISTSQKVSEFLRKMQSLGK